MLHAALLKILEFGVRNAAGLLVVALVFWAAKSLKGSESEPSSVLRGSLTLLSVGWITVMIVLFANHIRFPLFLDLMEGTVFQHLQRAADFQHIYTEPSPEFVPLAYNALFYVVSVPFSWIFGESLLTMRLVAVLATIGIGWLIFWILRRETASKWWGLVGSGLFAASYHVMDCYIDTAHADACAVLCSLAGAAIIHYNRSRKMRLLGLAILIASFWFKQHGAVFAIGGVVYLTWDEGWRRSWPYWILGFALGPASYLILGPKLFGPKFLYFTYAVPSAWSGFSLRSFARFGWLLVGSYAWMGLGAIWWFFRQFDGKFSRPSIWHIQLLAAFGTAIVGSLDEWSSNNVYIPFFTWLILCGVWGLQKLGEETTREWKQLGAVTLLVMSFALVLFNPLKVMRPWTAQKDYRDFVRFLENLDGDVYAPSLGQLPADYSFYPAAHWVALEDMVRGPGRNTQNHPMIQEILAPMLDSNRTVYFLGNYPLTRFSFFEYLNDHFVLQEDLADRFRPLRALPGRADHGWPRYLYRREMSASGGGALASGDPPPSQ